MNVGKILNKMKNYHLIFNLVLEEHDLAQKKTTTRKSKH